MITIIIIIILLTYEIKTRKNMSKKEDSAHSISTNELRFHFDKVLASVRAGRSLTLTYRNKPLARIEPILPLEVNIPDNDPLYHLDQFAEDLGSLTNEEIDQALYGK